MKIKAIGAKTDKELVTLVADERQKLQELVVKARTAGVPNVKQAKAHKLAVARALTVLRQRELAAADQPAKGAKDE